VNVLSDEDIPYLPEIETPATPLDEPYSHETLDLMAIWCTLTKIVYLGGNLEVVQKMVDIVHPTREGRTIHTTTIRNEHAYHCCIGQLLPYHTIPNNFHERPKIYIAGDSHSLVPAWQPITIKEVDYQIVPLLVTGCKCWHLRPESKFFPKLNFWNVVTQAPQGSSVIFGFGEIDCREGLVVSVQKCIYKDIEEGASVAVDIYIDVLLEVQRQKEYRIFIHPAAPVIDITREIVTTFNAILKTKLKSHPSLILLDFADDFLAPNDKSKLNPKFDLDGTHMNPHYLYAMERELNKVF
jgi:hypothetical protein